MTVARLRPPDHDERVLFLGSTGSGKSVLARELLGAGYRRTVALDLKGDFEPIQDHRLVKRPPWDDSRAWRADHVLYRPRAHELRTGHSVDQVLRWLFARAQDEYDSRARRPRKPRIVYLDESLLVAKSRHTQGISDLAVAGRALGVGLWVASQRPRWIPVEVRSEAARWFVFFLSYQDDEREVLRHVKGSLDLDQLHAGQQRYGFWEIRRDDGGGSLSMRTTQFPPVSPHPYVR